MQVGDASRCTPRALRCFVIVSIEDEDALIESVDEAAPGRFPFHCTLSRLVPLGRSRILCSRYRTDLRADRPQGRRGSAHSHGLLRQRHVRQRVVGVGAGLPVVVEIDGVEQGLSSLGPEFASGALVIGVLSPGPECGTSPRIGLGLGNGQRLVQEFVLPGNGQQDQHTAGRCVRVEVIDRFVAVHDRQRRVPVEEGPHRDPGRVPILDFPGPEEHAVTAVVEQVTVQFRDLAPVFALDLRQQLFAGTIAHHLPLGCLS
ncbi:hypothetical protein CA951_02540 [Rhodococcus sp. NCIMB 12038]|nr:hypothetical protein CA951_02540 [Rhodococcus sp. NCIMB 12038]